MNIHQATFILDQKLIGECTSWHCHLLHLMSTLCIISHHDIPAAHDVSSTCISDFVKKHERKEWEEDHPTPQSKGLSMLHHHR